MRCQDKQDEIFAAALEEADRAGKDAEEALLAAGDGEDAEEMGAEDYGYEAEIPDGLRKKKICGLRPGAFITVCCTALAAATAITITALCLARSRSRSRDKRETLSMLLEKIGIL